MVAPSRLLALSSILFFAINSTACRPSVDLEAKRDKKHLARQAREVHQAEFSKSYPIQEYNIRMSGKEFVIPLNILIDEEERIRKEKLVIENDVKVIKFACCKRAQSKYQKSFGHLSASSIRLMVHGELEKRKYKGPWVDIESRLADIELSELTAFDSSYFEIPRLYNHQVEALISKEPLIFGSRVVVTCSGGPSCHFRAVPDIQIDGQSFELVIHNFGVEWPTFEPCPERRIDGFANIFHGPRCAVPSKEEFLIALPEFLTDLEEMIVSWNRDAE